MLLRLLGQQLLLQVELRLQFLAFALELALDHRSHRRFLARGAGVVIDQQPAHRHQEHQQ